MPFFFACVCPVFPTPFIVYSCLLYHILNERIGVIFFFWALYSVPLINVSVFMPVPCCFDYCSLISGSVIPPALFFFLKIAVAI